MLCSQSKVENLYPGNCVFIFKIKKRRIRMKNKTMKKKLMSLPLAGTILCGSVSLEANAANVKKTMNWAGYGVVKMF